MQVISPFKKTTKEHRVDFSKIRQLNGKGNLPKFLSFLQKVVLDSIHEDDPTFTGDGYRSLALIYAVFALCNWLAPSVLSITGPKGAMLIGSVTYW